MNDSANPPELPDADAPAPVIPRLIHHIWIGYSRIPDKLQHCMGTWAEHHPDWEIRLWTEDNLPELQPDTFFRGESLLERGDVLRFELLRQRGGVYVDLDVECLRPIDPLLNGVSAFAAWEQPGRRVGTSVLGSVPGHPVFASAVREVEKALNQARPRPDWPAWKVTGPEFITEVISRHEEVAIFDPETFYYPLFGKATDVPYAELEDTYALHHSVGMGVELLDDKREIESLRSKLARTRLQLEKARAKRDAIEASRWWRLGRKLFRWS